MAWESNGETLVIGDMVPDNVIGIIWQRRYFGVPVIMYKTEKEVRDERARAIYE